MSIQLGYNHKINNNMKLPNSTKINGISYGIELLLSRFIVNYSRVVINSISSTNAISLSYNLKKTLNLDYGKHKKYDSSRNCK